MLELLNISKSFGRKKAVNSLNLTINDTCLGLFGPNGAGKSTALRIISTLLRPDSGDILYKGSSIFKDTKEWKKHIGVLPEYPELFENITIYEHL